MNEVIQCRIRPACLSDIPAIVAIAAEHLFNTKSPARQREEGFLVSGYSAEHYTKWLTHLMVAVSNNTVTGFLLGFPREQLSREVQDAEQLFAYIGNENFFLIKQVAVQVVTQGAGVGAMLYQHVLRLHSGIPVFAAIMLEPPNPRSVRFHETLGFSCFFEFKGGDGKPRGFWKHPNAQPRSPL